MNKTNKHIENNLKTIKRLQTELKSGLAYCYRKLTILRDDKLALYEAIQKIDEQYDEIRNRLEEMEKEFEEKLFEAEYEIKPD